MGTRQAAARVGLTTRGARKRRKATAAVGDRGALARPLDTLVFLLPWVLFYQVALIIAPPAGSLGSPDRVVAIGLLEVFFQLFGTTAVIMPGLAVVIILLCTHLASRESWRVDKRSILRMYVESIVLALPLLLVNHILNGSVRFIGLSGIAERHWLADVTLSIGAGIYEELVFRLVLISVLVIIGADLLRLPHEATTLAAVLVAAALFAAHHHRPMGSEDFTLYRFVFRTMAGVYLGAVFVFRGYGPAAGLHIAYNLLAVATTA